MKKRIKNRHRHHHYKNIALVLAGILCAWLLSRAEGFHEILLHFGGFGYLGAFVAGLLFVSTFTLPTGYLLLLIFAEKYSAIEIGIIAGLGAVLVDTLIFRSFRGQLVDELKDLDTRFGGSHLKHLLHTKYFSWSLPFLGAIIIASPLPDELGISLLGLSKMNTSQFMVVSFIMNFLGIILFVTLSTFVKP